MKHKVILDQTTRNRNIQHHLNELERDNYAEVPELEIVSGTITKPRRTSEVDTSQNRKTKARSKKQLLSQLTVKKNLNALLEESRIDQLPPDIPTYFTAIAGPSRYPPRKFCSVCGYLSNYSCKTCGMKYCSVKCLEIHEETRCMKYTV
ncbi:Zinc finger HIT domain-containing protein 1 [Gigaspora margarita]|uniref:Zinc finger HIT domain-containing protein 1 n=3 Tax=Gigasporaceae TaxID=36753 RepID=A0A8H3WXG4_GIGMA|nr:Zinc finger HIT domain-containing protein 1 [Gigaspora margarita]